MNKNGIIAGSVSVVVIAIIAAYGFSQFDSETLNLDMGQTHGTISTAIGSPILGDPDAPITIVEFGDYQCPNCNKWFHETKPILDENYFDTGIANLIYIDFAFLGKDSLISAPASYCAEEQGAYWQYHDLLYPSQTGIDDGWTNSERLKAFAFSLGLDSELFDSCLDSGKYEKRIQSNFNESKKQGANGTPTFIIVGPNGNPQMIVGPQPYSVFKNVIDNMI